MTQIATQVQVQSRRKMGLSRLEQAAVREVREYREPVNCEELDRLEHEMLRQRQEDDD